MHMTMRLPWSIFPAGGAVGWYLWIGPLYTSGRKKGLTIFWRPCPISFKGVFGDMMYHSMDNDDCLAVGQDTKKV